MDFTQVSEFFAAAVMIFGASEGMLLGFFFTVELSR